MKPYLNYGMELMMNKSENKIKIYENYLQMWQQIPDSSEMAETDFSDYMSNLENYEEKLARGEIKW